MFSCQPLCFKPHILPQFCLDLVLMDFLLWCVFVHMEGVERVLFMLYCYCCLFHFSFIYFNFKLTTVMKDCVLIDELCCGNVWPHDAPSIRL